MAFNNNNDIRQFASYLTKELEVCEELSLVEKLREWEKTSFTISSEFLGEFRLILYKIRDKKIELLKSKTKKQVLDCIYVINKAFNE